MHCDTHILIFSIGSCVKCCTASGSCDGDEDWRVAIDNDNGSGSGLCGPTSVGVGVYHRIRAGLSQVERAGVDVRYHSRQSTIRPYGSEFLVGIVDFDGLWVGSAQEEGKAY